MLLFLNHDAGRTRGMGGGRGWGRTMKSRRERSPRTMEAGKERCPRTREAWKEGSQGLGKREKSGS